MSFGGNKSKSKNKQESVSTQNSQLNPFAQFAATALLANILNPESFGDLNNFLGTPGGALGTGGSADSVSLNGITAGGGTPGGLPDGTVPQLGQGGGAQLTGGGGVPLGGGGGLEQLFANLQGSIMNTGDITERINSFRVNPQRPSFL